MPDSKFPNLEFIQIKQDGSVATVLLANPGKANAINKKMWFELAGAALAIKNLQSEIKVVILAGQGRHFCAGIHLEFLSEIFAEGRALPKEQQPAFLKQKIMAMQQAFHSFYELPQPVIAAVHGACLGAGLDLISACDIRLATYASAFSILETKLGIVADVGTLQRAPYFLNEGRLRELAYTSKTFSGRKARCWGMVNHLYWSQSQMMAKAMAMALEIAKLPDYAVFGSKAVLNENRRKNILTNLDKVAEYNSTLLTSEAAENFFKTVLPG